MGKFTKEEKRRRLRLLAKQAELHDKYCNECPRLQYFREEKRDTGSTTPDKLCEGCNVYTQLRKIGDKIVGSKCNSKKNLPQEKRNDLTLEVYEQMRLEGKKDKEIMEYFEIPRGSWYGIKKKIGAILSAEKRNYQGGH